MKTRTLTSLLLAALCFVLLSCFHLPFVPQLTCMLLGCGTAWEILNAYGVKKRAARYASFAYAIVLPLIPFWENRWLCLALLVLGLAFYTYLMLEIGKPVKNWMIFGSVFFSVGLYRSLAAFRQLPRGALALCLTGVICALTDIFAYLVGSRFGRHKLAPKVSPGKSVEGSLGALAVTVTLVTLILAPYAGNPWLCGLYVCACSILSQWGDLSMSAVKRLAGVKDFGHIFPGHGGILDRCDSLLYTMAFTWLLLRFL